MKEVLFFHHSGEGRSPGPLYRLHSGFARNAGDTVRKTRKTSPGTHLIQPQTQSM